MDDTRLTMERLQELPPVLQIAEVINGAMGGMLTVDVYMDRPDEVTICVATDGDEPGSGMAVTRIANLDIEAMSSMEAGRGLVLKLIGMLKEIGRFTPVIGQLSAGDAGQRIVAAGLAGLVQPQIPQMRRAMH